MPRLLEASISSPDGIDATLAESLEVCQRMHATLTLELKRVDGVLHEKATRIEAVQRLLTIPAVGERVALMVYAWVGDARRFRNARELRRQDPIKLRGRTELLHTKALCAAQGGFSLHAAPRDEKPCASTSCDHRSPRSASGSSPMTSCASS